MSSRADRCQRHQGSVVNPRVTAANFVLDASAFKGFGKSPEIFAKLPGRVIVTPHAGEMASFLDREREDVEGDMVGAARECAAITKGVVVMKGPTTFVASATHEEVWESDHGAVGLATSGSGDALAGILSGLLARGTAPLLAALWAVYTHGEAGRRLTRKYGALGLLAREIPAEIPGIIRDLKPSSR